MNIFATDPSPRVSAQALDDIRLNKMILESAQLLSTCHQVYETSVSEYVYKPTHNNHPCAVWVRESVANYKWLLEHLEALIEEWRYRRQRVHKTATLLQYLRKIPEQMFHLPQSMKLTPFVNCSMYKEERDVHEAYRKTMCDKWDTDVITLTWTKRGPPDWYEGAFDF